MYTDSDDASIKATTAIGGTAGALLVLIVLVGLGFAAAAVGAIAGGAVILLLTRAFCSGGKVSYSMAYRAAFRGIVAWIAVLAGTIALIALSGSELLASMLVGGTRWDTANSWEDLKYPTFGDIVLMLPVQLPALLACATMLVVTLPRHYRGVVGFLTACIVSLAAVISAVGFAIVVALLAAERLRRTSFEEIVTLFFTYGAVAFFFAVFGALVAGLCLWVYGRIAASRVPYSRAYAAGFLALLAWLGITMLIQFVLGTFSPLLRVYYHIMQDPASLGNWAVVDNGLPRLLAAFLLSQLPGLVVAAAIVRPRIHPNHASVSRYAGAFLASTFTLNAAILLAIGGIAVATRDSTLGMQLVDFL